jgi:hypothetical protein
VTGTCIFANEDDESNENHLGNLQSGSWCFPTPSIIANDNKDSYTKYLYPLNTICDELRNAGVPSNAWKPFIVNKPQTMKPSWICFKRGGPAKLFFIKHFCCLCQIRSVGIALTNQVQCTSFFNSGLSARNQGYLHHLVMNTWTINQEKFLLCHILVIRERNTPLTEILECSMKIASCI